MAVKQVHVGDIGTVLRVTVLNGGSAIDLSSATVKQLKLNKPSGTTVTKTAVFTTDGTDGKLQYVTVAGDISEGNVWQIQAYVEMPAGKWHSSWAAFNVGTNL